jgi:hypothetical protein
MKGLHFACGFGDKKTDLPMTSMKAKRNGSAVLCAYSSMCDEDQKFRVKEALDIPPHPHVLSQPK